MEHVAENRVRKITKYGMKEDMVSTLVLGEREAACDLMRGFHCMCAQVCGHVCACVHVCACTI